MKRNKILSLLAGVVAGVGIVGSANADPLIGTWDLTAEAYFANAVNEAGNASTITYGSGTQDVAPDAVLDSYVSWGGDSRQSYLVIGDDDGYVGATGTLAEVQSNAHGTTHVNGIVTDGAAMNSATFSHVNNVIQITNGAALDSVSIMDTLYITSSDPDFGGPDINIGPIELEIEFKETRNLEPVDPENPDPAGECGFVEALSYCDDIFVLTNPSSLTTPFYSDGSFLYYISLDILGLTTLSDAACAQAGEDSGCVGLVTQEGQVNTFNTEVRIWTREVAEPAMLGLLGLGLVIAGMRRRKA